ncbi:MAG: hypothetical protein JOZ81_24445, partial [Chloroflexi bacterium]|nr:hypothetical protein [Chloroflexota bacterium]
LPIVNGSFVTGDPRVMENPEPTAVTTLFMREHNFCVAGAESAEPELDGRPAVQHGQGHHNS